MRFLFVTLHFVCHYCWLPFSSFYYYLFLKYFFVCVCVCFVSGKPSHTMFPTWLRHLLLTAADLVKFAPSKSTKSLPQRTTTGTFFTAVRTSAIAMESNPYKAASALQDVTNYEEFYGLEDDDFHRLPALIPGYDLMMEELLLRYEWVCPYAGNLNLSRKIGFRTKRREHRCRPLRGVVNKSRRMPQPRGYSEMDEYSRRQVERCCVVAVAVDPAGMLNAMVQCTLQSTHMLDVQSIDLCFDRLSLWLLSSVSLGRPAYKLEKEDGNNNNNNAADKFETNSSDGIKILNTNVDEGLRSDFGEEGAARGVTFEVVNKVRVGRPSPDVFGSTRGSPAKRPGSSTTTTGGSGLGDVGRTYGTPPRAASARSTSNRSNNSIVLPRDASRQVLYMHVCVCVCVRARAFFCLPACFGTKNFRFFICFEPLVSLRKFRFFSPKLQYPSIQIPPFNFQ
jgi:hypothetical protein